MGKPSTALGIKGGGSFPLRLTPSTSTAPKRPQTPQAPFPYDVETVEFSNSTANISLAGTLTLPPNQQNCPAVILISGSGPQDRDETIMQHKPFLVVADYLTRQGMVVLRVDDRGVGESGGNFASATSADFASDVAAALDYLKKHPRVNARKVGLLGHSEGGMIAPLVASQRSDVAFLILMAGPGHTGGEVMRQQNYDVFLQQTKDATLAKQRGDFFETLYKTTLKKENADKSTTEILALLDEDWKAITAENRATLGLTEKELRAMVTQLRTPWMHYFLAFDPSIYLQQVSCPVLAINGDKDLQVHVNNLAAIETALKKGKNPPHKTLALKNLNHLFQTTETGAIEEYGTLEETLAPKVLTTIDEWLKAVAIY